MLEVIEHFYPNTVRKLSLTQENLPDGVPYMQYFIELVDGATLPAEITADQQLQYDSLISSGALKASLASHRYAVQSAGISVAGVPVSTDEVSLGKLTDAWIKSKFDDTITVSWVAGGAVYPLNAAQILAIGDAVFAFQQKCYASQGTVLQNLANYQTTSQVIAAFDQLMEAS